MGCCRQIEPFSISGESREYHPVSSSVLGPRGSNPSALSMAPSIITRTKCFFFFGLVAFFNLCLFLAGSLLPGVGFLQLSSVGFSVQWALSSQSTGSRAQRLQKPWPTGLAAPQHVGSSQTRDRTCVPCSSRQILNCRTTREIQGQHFKLQREAKSMPPDPGLEAIWGLR